MTFHLLEGAACPIDSNSNEGKIMTRFIRFTAAACIAVLAAAPAAYAQSDHGSGGHGGGSEASAEYMRAMDEMSSAMEGMEMSGKAGVDFARMMIPHHQSAIDMAEAYLASGEDDPELVKLSREIIEAQEAEIAFLREWLERNGQ